MIDEHLGLIQRLAVIAGHSCLIQRLAVIDYGHLCLVQRLAVIDGHLYTAWL